MRHALMAFLLLFCTGAQAEIKVLTSIKPIQLIAQAIQGQHGQTEVLLPPGASPHSFSLRPSDRKRLAEASLFYWIGPDMENFLSAITRQYPDSSVALQELSGLQLLYYADGHKHDEHGHEHGHEHEASHHEHDHHHLPGGLDSHLWLSTENALIIAERMAADLARLDAANARDYADNLDSFKQRLSIAHEQAGQLLASVKEREFFVFHEAINYFEQQYGLRHGGVLAISGEVQPGARHLKEMRQRLEQAGSTCILTEPPAPPRLARSLSKGLPVRLQEIDVLGSQAQSYEALILDLAKNLHQCLSATQ